MESPSNAPEQTISPLPKSLRPLVESMTFPEAMEKVIENKKVTKVEWGNNNIWAALIDGRLKLHMNDGQIHDWIISDGDLLGEDWLVVEEMN